PILDEVYEGTHMFGFNPFPCFFIKLQWIRAANFVDELLVKVYGLPPYYNVKRIEDLVGHLTVGLAPHTSVGVLGRIIGFTSLNVFS
ncbi:hypothetical protein, partial [Escherichia coli]|uniref:hypothetical protein n=1 Tax=Escherichia coli TaxID=562 RepID=UPI00128EB717